MSSVFTGERPVTVPLEQGRCSVWFVKALLEGQITGALSTLRAVLVGT